MRVHIGDLPPSAELAEGDGWTRIHGPQSALAHILAWLTGIALLLGLLALVIVVSVVGSPEPQARPALDTSTPWAAIILTLLLSVPAHELAHALVLPDHGFSPATVLAIWPKKLRFGLFFQGSMSRRRWLAMRLAPVVLLAIVPVIVLVLTAPLPRSLGLETCLSLLFLVNSLGSGGDIVAAAWVFARIPPTATLAFAGAKAYWRRAL